MKKAFSLFLMLLVSSQATSPPLARSVQDAAKNIQPSPVAAVSTIGNQDISQMIEAKLAPAIIVEKIRLSACDFDTSPAALQSLKASGVPDEVILAMVLAPRSERRGGAPSSNPVQAAAPFERLKIPAGTPLEIEAPFDVSSQAVRKGDRISFRVVNPVVVGGKIVIAAGATATARVTKAERGGHFGRAGRLAWSMEEVTAVDGTRIPVAMSSHLVGDSKGAKVATQTVLTGVLLWPIAPVALLHGLKRGENALLPAGKRFEAAVSGEATVRAMNVPR